MKGGLGKFLVKTGALKFGDFTLKSGRKSPYFVNTGVICEGKEFLELCGFLAAKIEAMGGCDVVYGPAYKGIPLAVGVAIALSKKGKKVYWLFNRKEEKAHGDRGMFVGHLPAPGESVMLVDDVFTTGGTKYENVELLKSIGVKLAAVVVAVDREERGKGGGSAVKEFEERAGVPVKSVASISEIFEELKGKGVSEEVYGRFLEYRREYGGA
ncbi:MAG: orotate phosphoribosyltransferase [Candidatus ainarchaeum sp.]|nr:orotate phosphoribosyltransferase [Candidatus ainarchaeum sp.]